MKGMNKMLHVSVSSLQDWMVCKRLYFYKRIKKYEKNVFSIPFLVGRVVHEGMAHLLAGKSNAVELMIEYFRKEKKKTSNEFTLTAEQLEDLGEQEYITKGMLEAYRAKYGKMLRDTKVLGSEVEGSLQFDDNVTLVIKLDNVIRVRKKKILHELKTTKSITPEYVRMIQTDFQTAVYYHAHNEIWERDKIEEVMYDVIRKPSIRQKKNESYQAFLTRLKEWYDRPGDESVFHIERFKEPKISREDVFNTVDKASQEMLRCKHKEDYYQDFKQCSSYYGDVCPYYELCHGGGETKENLVLYQVRKSYEIDKTNRGSYVTTDRTNRESYITNRGSYVTKKGFDKKSNTQS